MSIEVKYGHIVSVTENDDGSLSVDTGTCPFCQKAGTPILIPMRFAPGFAEWQNGAHIQKAMPGLDDDEREQLMSGIHGACFDAEFPEE